MPEFFPITRDEKVIINARTLPSLLEGGVPPCQGEDLLEMAFFLENGHLSEIRPLSPGEKETELKPGWRPISLPPNQFIVPAFVDCHLHLALDGVEGFRSFSAPPPPQLLFTRLQALATAGVLAVRDGGDQFGSAFAAQKLRAEANSETEPLPQIIATGPALFRHGHYGVKLGGKGLDSLHELESEIGRRKDAGAQHLKVVLSGLVSLEEPCKVGPLQFTLAELRDIVKFAAACELPVMVHASSDTAVRLAVQAGVHSVEHGYFVKEETLREMADRGVAWIPTVAPLAALTDFTDEPKAEGCEAPAGGGARKGYTGNARSISAPHNTPATMLRCIVEQQLRMIARAHALGVILGVGTDGGAPGVSWSDGYWLELALLGRAELASQELLTLAAVNGAAVLGLNRERGRINVGKPPSWLCMDMDFLAGRIEQKTLKGIIFPRPGL